MWYGTVTGSVSKKTLSFLMECQTTFTVFQRNMDWRNVVGINDLVIAPVMRYEMTLVHVLMFISFLNLTSINTVRTKIKVRVFYK